MIVDPALIVVVLILGIVIGGGFFYVLFQLMKEADHQVLDERGLGRRPPPKKK